MFIKYRELSPLHPEQQNSLSKQALWRVLPYNSNRVSQTKNSAAAFCIHLRAGTDSCLCPFPLSLSSVSLKLRSLCEF